MDAFRTPLVPPPAPFSVSYSDSMLFIGSCFTEHIGQKMESLKFPVCVNPFGILYNPVSIANMLIRLADGKEYAGNDLFFHNGLWHSFDHHGKFSGADKEKVLQQINDLVRKGRSVLSQASCVFITLGSSHIYRYRQSGQIVANCHKLPDREFDREILTVEQIVSACTNAWQHIAALNRKARLVFSVSPVRHMRYGLTGNQYSKAILLVAVYEMLSQIPGSFYFPAYEIMMDDLRDYRFYEADMIHPNETAINYIWEAFKNVFIAEESRELIPRVQHILSAVEHRLINPDSSEYKQFVKNTLEEINQLGRQYPFLNFSVEKNILQKNLF